MATYRFEQSKADKEPRGMKEGSAREEAYDKQQMCGCKEVAFQKPGAMNPNRDFPKKK